MASERAVGSLVWAKMKSYPWWPAMVVAARDDVRKPSIKKPMHFVKFFGSDNYAWILDTLIQSYEDNYNTHCNSGSAAFKQAMVRVEEYVAAGPIKKVETPKPKEKAETSQTNGVPAPKKKTPKLNKSVSVRSEKSEGKATKRSSPSPSSSSETPAKKRRAEMSNSVGSSKSSGSDNKYDNLKKLSSFIRYPSPTDPDASSTWLSQARKINFRPPPKEVEEYDIDEEAEELPSGTVMARDITALQKRLGFIGLGIMGRGMATNLVNTGHEVTVYNRSSSKTKSFENIQGVTIVATPDDVVIHSDIIFCCVSNPTVSKELVFGNCGVLKSMSSHKAYVEMTSIDPTTSKDIHLAITEKGGQYLECPVIGSRESSIDGELIALAAGDDALFNEIKPCLQAISRHAFFLGEVGNASVMNIILSTLQGTSMACLAECMSLAKKINLSRTNFLELLALVPYSSAFLTAKARAIANDFYYPSTPLEHLQKNLQLALELADRSAHPLPTIAAANEVFKHAKHLGYSKHDVSSVYMARF